MTFSSNALALFFCITVTTITTTTNAFVPKPPLPLHSNIGKTTLGYIKEGYDTGISPDFLNQKKKKRRSPYAEINIEDKDVIDAVIVEEEYEYFVTDRRRSAVDEDVYVVSDKREPFLDDSTQNYDGVVNVDGVVEKIKRELSNKNPADLFPDLQQQQEQEQAPPSIWDTNTAKTIQGGSLRTWSMEYPEVDHTQVLLKNNDGNPLHAQIEVWDGPDRSPMKRAIYCANTSERPFSCVVPTPGRSRQSISIRNSGPLDFPVEAVVIADIETVRAKREHQQQQQQQQFQRQRYSHQSQQNQRGGFYRGVDINPAKTNPRREEESLPKPTSGLGLFAESLRSLGGLRKIDGCSPVDYASPNNPGQKNNEEVFEFEKNVDSIQVLIETSGMACQARIEVTYDYSHDYYSDDEIRQVVELEIEDGKAQPFFAVIETPMNCPATIRIINLDTYSAFPITASVEPYTIGYYDEEENEDEYCLVDNVMDACIEEKQYHSIPDITIPATDVDYDFNEQYFFAN